MTAAAPTRSFNKMYVYADVQHIADIVLTTLGPVGMDKTISSGDQEEEISVSSPPLAPKQETSVLAAAPNPSPSRPRTGTYTGAKCLDDERVASILQYASLGLVGAAATGISTSPGLVRCWRR